MWWKLLDDVPYYCVFAFAVFWLRTCFDSLVSFEYFLLLRDLQWFQYLVLKFLLLHQCLFLSACCQWLLHLLCRGRCFVGNCLAFYGVSAVTWPGAVCVRWLFLTVVSLQYFIVVPFDGIHIFAAATLEQCVGWIVCVVCCWAESA